MYFGGACGTKFDLRISNQQIDCSNLIVAMQKDYGQKLGSKCHPLPYTIYGENKKRKSNHKKNSHKRSCQSLSFRYSFPMFRHVYNVFLSDIGEEFGFECCLRFGQRVE